MRASKIKEIDRVYRQALKHIYCVVWFVFGIGIVAQTHVRAETLRVVEYNIDCSDQGNNDNIIGPSAGIPAVLQAIGQHHIGTNAQPPDVIALTELLDTGNNSTTSTTLPALVNALNARIPNVHYVYDTAPDPTSGGTQFNGPSGLIYNTNTVQVVSGSETALGYSGTNKSLSIPRAPMRYILQPVGYGSDSDFYLYLSHYKASNGTSNETTRNQEATEIRVDADALPANSHIIYTGDFNLSAASSEPSYTTLTAAGSGRAYDPTASSTSYVSTFANNSDTWKYLYSESTTSLTARFDMQLVSGAMIGSSKQPGLQLAADSSDPSDPNNFPAAQYPYAYEIFGNNGSTAEGASTNLSSNTSLSDLSNASTIKDDLMQPSGSDHLPVVADYSLIGVKALPKPGDFNRDAHVDVSDVAAMMAALTNLSNYQATQGLTDAQLLTIGDLDGDRKVTNADLQALLNLLKSGGGSAAPVPEPDAAVLACICGALVMIARRRSRPSPVPHTGS